MSPQRFIYAAFAAIFLAFSIAAGVFLMQTYREFQQLKQQGAENRHRLAEAEQRLADQKQFLENLKSDPAFAERVIRERLGYAKTDEVIFRFEH